MLRTVAAYAICGRQQQRSCHGTFHNCIYVPCSFSAIHSYVRYYIS